jgi:hypothetical protein
MSDHLRQAAARRSTDAEARARNALTAMTRADEPVGFVAVARRASVSTDFLYRHPELRAKIESRRWSRPMNAAATAPDVHSGAAVSALAERLRRTQTEHRAELAELRAALATAHGENLRLRRQLQAAGITPQPA